MRVAGRVAAVLLLAIAGTATAAIAGRSWDTPAPTPPATTLPASPFSFKLKCRLDSTGPTNHAFIVDNQRGTPGPGYGHRAFNYTDDAFYIVAHDPISGVPNARVMAVLPDQNCSVAWTFIADAPISQPPMIDGQAVVFQSWNETAHEATAYGVDATSGREKWRQKVGRVEHDGLVVTSVHDGRAIIAALTRASAPSDGGLFEYRINARHADSGQLLWEWLAVTSWDSGVPASVNRHMKLWVAYNTEANRGFANFGSTLISFSGNDGGILFNRDLAWNLPRGTNTTGLTSTSATAQMGFFECPTPAGALPKMLYLVAADHDQQIFNVTSLNQCDGTLVKTSTGAPAASVAATLPIQGPPSTSKYVDTVCVTAGGQPDGHAPPSIRNLACFNGSATSDGVPGWTVAPGAHGAGFSSLPSVGYSDPGNYVLSTVLEHEYSTKARIELREPRTGALAFAPQMVELSATNELVAVGYPKTFESGWDLALLGVGKSGQSGAFAVYHVEHA